MQSLDKRQRIVVNSALGKIFRAYKEKGIEAIIEDVWATDLQTFIGKESIGKTTVEYLEALFVPRIVLSTEEALELDPTLFE